MLITSRRRKTFSWRLVVCVADCPTRSSPLSLSLFVFLSLSLSFFAKFSQHCTRFPSRFRYRIDALTIHRRCLTRVFARLCSYLIRANSVIISWYTCVSFTEADEPFWLNCRSNHENSSFYRCTLCLTTCVGN